MGRKNKKDEIINTLGIGETEPRKKKSGKGKWFLLLVLIAIPVLLVAWFGPPEHRQQQVRYKSDVIKRGDLTVYITATGNLAPTNKVEVGSELSGIVRTVTVDFNDRVEAGQVLAQLDDTNYIAAVMEARAALASSEANYQQAQASLLLNNQNMKRLKQVYQLSGGKAPSKGEMETAEAGLQRAKADESVARAAIQQATARLKIDETNLAKTIIKSPISGVVLRRNVDTGQTVAASLQAPVLFTLAEDLTKLELKVDVDEADVGLVQEGQKATFTVESHSGRLFDARITQLRYDSQINNGVVTYPALLSVDNTDLTLRPGMTATVKIVVKNISNAILIPNAALRFTPPEQTGGGGVKGRAGLFGLLTRRPNAAASPSIDEKNSKIEPSQARVWVLKGDQLSPMPVNTGLSNGEHTEMTAGNLEPGMRVVVDVVAEQ